MNLEVLPDALEELGYAFLFYETQVPRLCFQFLTAVEEGFHRILLDPQAWTILQHGKSPAHRCLIRRFSFGLIYKIKEKKIVIVAITHLSREPGYWKKRPESLDKRKKS
jgi:toxin ParE1/3/4